MPLALDAGESFIHYQLRVVRGLMGYKYGDDAFDAWFANELSRVLIEQGVSDIRNLALEYREWACKNSSGNAYPPVVKEYRYVDKSSNRGVTDWHFLSARYFDPESNVWNTQSQITEYCEQYNDEQIHYPAAIAGNQQTFAFVGGYGEFNVWAMARYLDNGVPFFLPHKINRRGMSFFAALRELGLIVLAAVSFIVPGATAGLTAYIFGSYAVTYPALTVALTNVMMQTALNGGDIEAAVTSAATASIGSAIGSVVNGVSDSVAIGRLSAVAATTAINGGDVERAVAMAALQMAPGAIVNLISDADVSSFVPIEAQPEGTDMSSVFDIPTTAPQFEALDFNYETPNYDEWATAAVMPIDIDFSGGNVPEFAPQFQAGSMSFDDWSFDTSSPALEVAQIEAEPAESFFNGITFENVVDNVTELAVAAIKINQAYQAAQRPPVQPGVQTTRTGATQTARADGTLITTDPITGRSVVTRPAAGVPYEIPGGGSVINNGNGTYTAVSGTGQIVTRPYAVTTPQVGSVAVTSDSEWITGVPNVAIIGAGALLAAVLLLKGK